MRQRMPERFNQQFAAFRATLDDEAAARSGTPASRRLVSARRAPLYKLVDGKPQAAMVRIGGQRRQQHRSLRRHRARATR